MKEQYATKRLLLIPANKSLTEAVTDYYVRNRTFFQAYDPVCEEEFFTHRYQQARLDLDEQNAMQAQGYRFYLVKKEQPQQVMGMVALNGIVWGSFCSCFLGYKLDKDHLRQGLMSEAVQECVRIAFEELGLHRIEANIMPRNLPSLGVAEKCGFVREGISRKYLKINGVWEDHIHMVRLNETE